MSSQQPIEAAKLTTTISGSITLWDAFGDILVSVSKILSEPADLFFYGVSVSICAWTFPAHQCPPCFPPPHHALAWNLRVSPSCLWTLCCWTTILHQCCLHNENLTSSLHLEQRFHFQSFHTFFRHSQMVCKRPFTLTNRTSRTLVVNWHFSSTISLMNADSVKYLFLLGYVTNSGRASTPGCTSAPCPDLSSLLPSFGVETNCGLKREGSDSSEENWDAVLFLCVPTSLVSSLTLTYRSYHQYHVIS